MTTTQPKPVFVYGTLCATPLLAWALTGNSSQVSTIKPLICPARVDGFARYCLHGRDYPAAVECEGSEIHGYLVNFRTSSQRKKLDDFEGEVYKAYPVQVHLLDDRGKPSGEAVLADMYV